MRSQLGSGCGSAFAPNCGRWPRPGGRPPPTLADREARCDCAACCAACCAAAAASSEASFLDLGRIASSTRYCAGQGARQERTVHVSHVSCCATGELLRVGVHCDVRSAPRWKSTGSFPGEAAAAPQHPRSCAAAVRPRTWMSSRSVRMQHRKWSARTLQAGQGGVRRSPAERRARTATAAQAAARCQPHGQALTDPLWEALRR